MKASKMIEVLQELITNNDDVEVQMVKGGQYLNIVPVGQVYFDDSDNTILIDE